MLTHPLLVDAIERLFVPVCIYNNTKGDDDAHIRDAFKEPSWNNPVVRIIDAERKDVVPRLAGDWTVGGLAGAMVAALKKRGGEVPPWLRFVTFETQARKRGVESAVFGMT